MQVPDDVKDFLNGQKLGYVATVSADNLPNLSPKGTIIVWGSNKIAFANIRSPNTMQNLQDNPNLEINVIDPLLRKGYRIKGKGAIHTNDPIFDEILSHYRKNGIQSPIDAIVLVDVSKILPVNSPLYDLGFTEEQIKTKWKNYFSES